MLIENIFGIQKKAAKSEPAAAMTITTNNGTFTLKESDFTKTGKIRVAVAKKLKELGVAW